MLVLPLDPVMTSVPAFAAVRLRQESVEVEVKLVEPEKANGGRGETQGVR